MLAGDIRVVKLDYCCVDGCQYIRGDDLHPVISFQDGPLSDQQAVAISYTWGEFNRRQVPLGHDIHGRVYEMELGDEWVTQEFINKLVELSMEHSAC